MNDEEPIDDFDVSTEPAAGPYPLHFHEDMTTFMELSEMTHDDLADSEGDEPSIAGMDSATFGRLAADSDSMRQANEMDAGRHFENQQGFASALVSLETVQAEMLSDHERRLRDLEDMLRRSRGEL